MRRTAQPVDRPQLARRLGRGAGHAGEQEVAAEEALVGDARQRLAARRSSHAFLGLDHLVQALLPRAVGHARGRCIRRRSAPCPRPGVVLVALEAGAARESAWRSSCSRHGAERHSAAAAPRASGRACASARRQQLDVALARPMRKSRPASRPRATSTAHCSSSGCVASPARLARDDQRRARLVDQHAVGLVDDREVQAAQQHAGRAAPRAAQSCASGVTRAGMQPVAGDAVLQVVEHQLLVADVADVVAIGRAALGRLHAALDARAASGRRTRTAAASPRSRAARGSR